MRVLSPVERIIAWRLATGGRITKLELKYALFRRDAMAKNVKQMIKRAIEELRYKCDFIEIKNHKTGGYYIDKSQLDNFKNWLSEEIKHVNYDYKISGKRTYKYHVVIPQSTNSNC